jgi:hypothetical protein
MNDIDASETSTWVYGTISGFYPIGTTVPFEGVFDGNGFAISNLTSQFGLFGFCSLARIKNLTLEDCVINGGVPLGSLQGTAALVAQAEGSAITNCSASGVVSGYRYGAGALVGYSTAGSISGCNSSCTMTGYAQNTGGLVGLSSSDTILNCYATGDITVNMPGGYGGLVGTTSGTTILSSHATGDVGPVGNGGYQGGLVGRSFYDLISGCYATGNVTGTMCPGGLIASAAGSTITNCYATGTVTSNGNAGCGGLIGDSNATVTNSHASGAVFCEYWGVGGLVYRNSGSLTNCYANGPVTVIESAGQCTGGLVGENYGTITRCHASGTVMGGSMLVGGLVGQNMGLIDRSYANAAVTGKIYAGGLIGDNEGSITNCYASGSVNTVSGGGLSAINSGTITNCYATGALPNKTSWDNSGLINSASLLAAVNNSYWDMNTSGLTLSNAGGTGKTTSEMQNVTTYSSWDFISTWAISPSVNNGYPYLRDMAIPETVAPQVSYLAINDGATTTGVRLVTLNNRISNMPYSCMASESADFAGATWQSYSVAPTFTLSAGAGAKTVYFKVKNYAGVESNVVAYTITRVSITPVVSSFAINNGAASTTTRNVTLNNACAGGEIVQYMASESSSFAGAVWATYATAPAFTISTGTGTKTIYFKVRNDLGVESAVVSDTIKRK